MLPLFFSFSVLIYLFMYTFLKLTFCRYNNILVGGDGNKKEI
jgi:hypothetical protein